MWGKIWNTDMNLIKAIIVSKLHWNIPLLFLWTKPVFINKESIIQKNFYQDFDAVKFKFFNDISKDKFKVDSWL